MPRDVLTPADLLGRIRTPQRRRHQMRLARAYRVRTLVREIGVAGNIAHWLSSLSADCPRKNAATFADRCDVRCLDLIKIASRGDDTA